MKLYLSYSTAGRSGSLNLPGNLRHFDRYIEEEIDKSKFKSFFQDIPEKKYEKFHSATRWPCSSRPRSDRLRDLVCLAEREGHDFIGNRQDRIKGRSYIIGLVLHYHDNRQLIRMEVFNRLFDLPE